MGRLGGKTLLYYLTTSLLAILRRTGTGQPGVARALLMGNLPGRWSAFIGEADTAAIAAVSRVAVPAMSWISLFAWYRPILWQPLPKGRMLGLIFFSLLFGYFMTRIDGPRGRSLKDFWHGVFES